MTSQDSSTANSPNSESKGQKKRRFIKAARKYARTYRDAAKDHTSYNRRRLRTASRELAEAAQNLPPATAAKPEAKGNPPDTKPPIVHLLGAGHGYRREPTRDNMERLAAMAVNWYQTDQIDPQRKRGEHHQDAMHKG